MTEYTPEKKNCRIRPNLNNIVKAWGERHLDTILDLWNEDPYLCAWVFRVSNSTEIEKLWRKQS